MNPDSTDHTSSGPSLSRTNSTEAQPELASEPAAYWTRLAYESVIAFTRVQQRRRGFTQPQFWLLRHLSPKDLAMNERGQTVPELVTAMSSYLRQEDDLAAEAAVLVERGLLTTDGGRLRITSAGEAAREEWAGAAGPIRALIHDGIDDVDYATTVKVLQRLIHNTRQ
ncbi:MarR family transcriptional regulator [Tsukamurella sp. 8F]|uniref:MarR family transcriptional regulator n=1 Tax=unclassified Tsukamurella TaxID=2633480 RepID=UPI0023B91580|nr:MULTISPECIES: MarR family transcriptional regulator [unclassified Tsukamurella]MDF0528815.1 MarR family transcriptional regulator [Tsukamurella sp. 8J]MDF0586650.1 MarR family transcriptional regulator [Tsukamurella sp. 8F]